LLGLLDQHNFGSQLFEPAAVRVEIALQGQDSDGHADLILPEQQKIKIPQRGRDPGAIRPLAGLVSLTSPEIP